MAYILKCYCSYTIFLPKLKRVVNCPSCGRSYILKRGYKYVLRRSITL